MRAMWGGSWVWGMVPAMSGWQSPTPHYPSPLPQYTLVRDVVSSLRRHRMHEQQFTHPPLLVLNSFGPHGMHVKLMATMFQNLFPSINVHKVGWAWSGRCGWMCQIAGTTQALGLMAQFSLPSTEVEISGFQSQISFMLCDMRQGAPCELPSPRQVENASGALLSAGLSGVACIVMTSCYREGN